MRVLLANSLLPPITAGGAGRSVHELAEELIERGHSVRVLSIAPETFDRAKDAEWSRRYLDDTIVEPILGAGPSDPIRKMLWHASELKRRAVWQFVAHHIEDFAPDVFNLHNISGFGLQVWRSARVVPLVQTLRDYQTICVKSTRYRDGQNCRTTCATCVFARTPYRRFSARPTAFVGVSLRVLELHRAGGIITDEPTYVVANQPRSAPVAPTAPSAGYRFGYLGRLATEKGIWVLLDAFRAINDPGARLVIAGKPGPGGLARLGDHLEADARVTYLGEHVDAADFYRQVDAVVIPSQWEEPFGRVAVEAAAAGRHVVAARIGGLPEALEGHASVLVDDVESPTAWARAMQSSISEGRGEFVTPIARSQDPVGAQYENVYERAISDWTGRRCN